MPQPPFPININYHKIPLRVFLGDIRIPPDLSPCPPLTQVPLPHPIALHPCPIFLPKPLPHPLALGHLVTRGPPTPPNLNISTIRVRDLWVSIQINFWASLLPTGEVLHTCKIIYYFQSAIYFGSFFCPGSTHISEFKYHGNMGYRSLGINSNQLLGVCTTYRRSAAHM